MTKWLHLFALVCAFVLLVSLPTVKAAEDAVTSEGDEEIFSALLDSAAQRDIDGIRRALDEGENIDVTNVNGWTAASFAVAGGDIETLEYLINEGIDLNIANVDGYTPLMLAALQSDKEMVELLLNSNADPTIAAAGGETAYSIANDSGRPVNAHIILEGLVVRGIYNDDTDLILDSIRKGAYVNVRSGGGWNALIWACANGKGEAVAELLELGANVNHVENEGWAPLHFAALNGHYDIVRALLMRPEIDTALTNNNGQTARDLASGHANIIEALDAHEASQQKEF